MMSYTALCNWTAPTAPICLPFSHLDRIRWVPLADNELLPAAHLFPLAVRLDDARPAIGALVARDHLARDLIGADGKWVAPYLPMALRCFPFRLAVETPTADPLADLEFARPPSAGASPTQLRLKDATGQPAIEIRQIHEALKTVWHGQHRLHAAFDHLLVGDLLIPVAGAEVPHVYTVDRRRFARLSPLGLEAFVRTNLAALDLVTALMFSQRHLRAELRPAPLLPEPDETSATATGLAGGLDLINTWLDTSELFPGAWAADPSIWNPAAADERSLIAPASPPRAG